jgi:hypothetical protein
MINKQLQSTFVYFILYTLPACTAHTCCCLFSRERCTKHCSPTRATRKQSCSWWTWRATRRRLPSGESLRLPSSQTGIRKIGTRLIFSIANAKLISFCVTTDSDYYITAADWVGDSNDFISVTWMNRAQNLSIVTTCHHDQNWTCHGVSTNISF